MCWEEVVQERRRGQNGPGTVKRLRVQGSDYGSYLRFLRRRATGMISLWKEGEDGRTVKSLESQDPQ